MGLKEDITKSVKEIIETNVTIENVSYVPEITDPKLTFTGAGLKFFGTVLYIDMRDSTEVLNKHNRPTIAKIHKAYLHTTVKIATDLGGEVRSFNGDSVLAFFPGNSVDALNAAVKAAMQICWMITSKEGGINELLSRYAAVNFGIGIDFGEILCTKIGVGRDNNTKDLIWIGNAVNRSVVISDECSAYQYIGISNVVYGNLTDDLKFYTSKDALGADRKVDMWTRFDIKYNSTQEIYYKTHYAWSI